MTDLSSRRKFMQEALNAARQSSARVSPNPRVGAVLVKGDKIIAQGWHNGPGTAHAEVMAIHAAGPATIGSTLYVTLEPCNHFGRTPPCTKAIIEAGISKVHVALSDPNPQVSGRGTARLRQAGIDVIYDDEAQDDAAELNRPYLLDDEASTVGDVKDRPIVRWQGGLFVWRIPIYQWSEGLVLRL